MTDTEANPYQNEDHQLPEGDLPIDRINSRHIREYSLTAHAIYAMDRHKWIESVKRGYDVGERIYHEWLDRYWNGWVRSKLLEHLFGIRWWGGFSEDDYSLFVKGTVEHRVSRQVLSQTCRILGNGGENLDVINWALLNNCEIDTVLWLLDRIDINAKRRRLTAAYIRLFLY